MARDYFDESKPKKKKKEETAAKKKATQSPSASKKSTQQTTSRQTQNTSKRNTPARSVTQNERINQKSYGTTNPRTQTRAQRTQTAPAQRQETTQNRQISSAIRRNNTQSSKNPRQEIARQRRENTASTAKEMMAKREQESGARSGVSKAIERRKDPLSITQNSKVENRYDKSNASTAKQAEEKAARQKELKAQGMAAFERKAQENDEKLKKEHPFIYDVQKTSEHTLKEIGKEDSNIALRALKSGIEKDKETTRMANKKLGVPEDKRTEGMEDTLKQIDKKIEKNTAAIEKEKKSLSALREGKSWLEQRALGAEQSVIGMLTDMPFGKGASLVHLGARSAESSRGDVLKQAEPLKKQMKESGLYSDEEIDSMFADMSTRDVVNAKLQGTLESLTEMLGAGIGPATGYVGKGGGLLDKSLSSALGKSGNMTMGKKIAYGIGEEELEEQVNGPAGAFISNLVYGNKLQGIKEDYIRREFMTSPENAALYAAKINSKEFEDQSIASYMENGASEEEAKKLTEITKDYYASVASGDVAQGNKKLDEIVNILAGGEGSMKEKWTFHDALDTFVETGMVSGLGAFGAARSEVAGKNYVDKYGLDSVHKMADIVRSYDPSSSFEAKAVMNRIDEGKDITGTQVSIILEKAAEAASASLERQTAKDNTAAKRMLDEDLRISPAAYNEDGTYDITGPETAKRYTQILDNVNRRVSNLRKINKDFDISDQDAEAVSDTIAAFLTGTVTANQLAEVGFDNTEARAIFKDVTGVDLDGFNVKDRKGRVDVAASNIKMQNALFAQAAERYVESARIEQEAWNDEARGAAMESITGRMMSNGDIATQSALQAIDPRDKTTFELMTRAADKVYEIARNTEGTWDEFSSDMKHRFPSLNQNALREVFEAGKLDKEIENTPYIGMSVNIGDVLSSIKSGEQQATVRGKFLNQSNRRLKGSEQQLLQLLAQNFNLDIVLVNGSDIDGANGSNDLKGTIILNADADMAHDVIFTASHELTHQLKVMAPEEFKQLLDAVRDRWYRADAEDYKAAIQEKKAQYLRQKNQKLTDDEALEEIIADGSHEFWNDEDFVNEICEENPSLARKIVAAIDDLLRKLRSIIATGRVKEPASIRVLFSELEFYDEAKKLWLDAYHVAENNSATVGLVKWDEKARETSAEEETGDQYSYDYLTSLDPMPIASVADSEFEQVILSPELKRSDIVNATYKNIGAYNSEQGNGLGDRELHNKYIGDTRVTPDGLKHPFKRMRETPSIRNAVSATVNLPLYFENAVPINMAKPGRKKAGKAHILLGAYRDAEGKLNIVRIDVNDYTKEIEGIKSLYAISAKKEEAATNAALIQDQLPSSDLSIAELLDIAKEYFPDELSEDVADRLGYERGESVIEGLKFSLDEPIERVRDLIAVHNIWPDDLIRSLDMGGFAMPSIAVIRDNMEHDKYGSISLLFGSDTIDPQRSRDNRVWGGDAYTPTFPTIERKFDEEKGLEIEQHLLDIFGFKDRSEFHEATPGLSLPSLDQDNLSDKLRYGTAPSEAYERDLTLRLAFLMEKGNAPAVPLMPVNMNNEDEAFWADLASRISEEDLEEQNMKFGFQETMDKFEPIIREARKDARNDKEIYKRLPGMAAKLDEPLGFSTVDSYLNNLRRYYNAGGMPQRVDETKLRDDLESRIDENEYKAWLDDLFDGIVEAEGIRNDRDLFTDRGNRRSWESLHNPVTVQNVVAAMKSGLQSGQGNFNGVVKGAAQKEYKSLDDIREDEGRLQKLDDEEYKAILDEAEAIVDSALDSINDHNPTGSSYYIRTKYDIGSYVAEILNKTRKRDTIQNKLLRDYDIEATDEEMDTLMEGIEAIAEIPTGYFEAKPARAVPFTEVKAAVLPAVDSSISTELRERLKDDGIEVYEYDSSKEGDRQRAVNEAASAQDIKFSLSDSEGVAISEGQASFFERSQNRDQEGRLKVMLHGTDAEFTEFDPSKAKPGTLGRAFYFTDSASHAGQYGNVGRYYLNLEQPLTTDSHDITKEQLRRFIAELASDDEYGIENYGADATVDSVTDSIWGGTDFAILRDLNLSAVGDFAEALKVFNRVNGTEYDGIITGIETVAFYPQQIKRTDNLNPTLNKDTRYSITDSDGAELSDGQVDFFKKSLARDDLGRLIPMYHVTRTAGFTVFDPSLGFDETSISFSNDIEFALNYSSEDGSVEDWRTAYENRYGMEEIESDLDNEVIGHYKVYLNMENPLIVTDEMFEDMSIYEWPVYAKANGYDGVIHRDFDGFGADIYQVFSSDQIKDTRNLDPTENPDIRYSIADEDEALSQLAYDDAIDDSYEALEYYEVLYDLNKHDAEIYLNTPQDEESLNEFYAALNSDENVPFTDPVLEEGRVRIAKSKREFYNSVSAKWRETWTTEGEVLDLKSVEREIRNVVKNAMANSDTDAKYRQEIVNHTLLDVREAYQLMKQGRTDIACALLYRSAQNMISNLEFIQDDGTFEEYKAIRSYLHSTKITLDDSFWHNETFLEFRKSHFGTLRLAKGQKSNVDIIYQELEERFPGIFSESARETLGLGDAEEDLLEHIGYVVDQNVKPFMEAYSSEEAAELSINIAGQLYDIMEAGRPIESIGDQLDSKGRERLEGLYQDMEDAEARLRGEQEAMKAGYEERISGMKRDHEGDIALMEHQTKMLKVRHEEAMQKLKERKEAQAEKKIQKLKEKQKQKEQKTKKRSEHKKYFERIKATHDKLTERLLSNTKDAHIPEQYKKELAKLLAAFDLQTERSKSLEKSTGHKAKKTIKMGAIRSALESIEKKSDLFHVNDAITDLMEELLSVEGQSIDSLPATELEKVDKLLKALLHEFNHYEKVKVNMRNVQAADLANAQVKTALEHAATFGPGNDYNWAKGYLDEIINMDEMTPAYMFRRIDPDSTGLGVMWKEIRRSQDKYIRNTELVTQWMQEIIGEYHNKGKFGKKYGADQIEEWRSTNYTQTFQLENGTVRLTPAQMMSLYCLSKRSQAYGHMVGAGIVVAPVSFQAKIMSDLKKKTNRALPVILTDADIKRIVEALTPEQVKVADKLQELMVTKMADWGNEASMNVIGIKLFTESDYFPIKSDRAALEKDLTNEQFENAIRNFGFTKAVQPGARNAIMIEDIFDVVTEHCNNMNLYNAYSETLNDFMKVYNKHSYQEDGSDYSVAQALAHAYSQKSTTFIMEFIRDLNGNVSRGRRTGIDNAINNTIANAKKASVFANMRVLVQQPTAITRAFAVINPKYLKAVRVEKGAMEEMWEHCPIALWKSWGYYDINMGKTIEDVIMNNGNWLEDAATQAYGAADNVTWTAIWQMVKAEAKDTHPEVKEGTDEFWDLCNERMSEIVDLTQVVDSPLHRSHAMRSRDPLHRTLTSFMAEPTLTFNMIRDGYVRAREAWIKGDKAEATKIMSKTVSVTVLQAATVAAAAALVDALRGKGKSGDDDEDYGALWWTNFINNFKDEMKLWNKVYYIKDIASIKEGWDAANIMFQGWKNLFDGYNQLEKKLFEGSKTPWWTIYYNLFGGIGSLSGVPVRTLMRDGRAIFELFGLELPENLVGESKSDSVIAEDSALQKMRLFNKKDSSEKSSSGSVVSVDMQDKWYDYENNPITVKDGSAADKLLNHFGINLTAAEKKQIASDQKEKAMKQKAEEINSKYADLSGEERDKKVWSAVTTYIKNEDENSKSFAQMVEAGEYGNINRMKRMYLAAGGETEYFDGRVFDESKKALKKSIKYDPTQSEIDAQEHVVDYLLGHGMTEEELSGIVYKSDTAKDMKIAFRINDKDAMMETLLPLVRAGLTYEDLERIWENRNRMDVQKYKSSGGRYADRLKSTGTYVWPTQGTITSHFGYRNAPTAGASTNHMAIDIGAAQGTPVVAADGGVVVEAGSNGGYGNSVGIKHDDGTISYYNHLYSWNVKAGDTVAQGQEIAQVGSTGISTGPHLDFRLYKDGEYLDPEVYLTGSKKS